RPYLTALAERVLSDANRLLRQAPLREGSEPQYQPVTRAINAHLQCLTCAWVLTHDPRYRQAAILHLAGLTAFNQISCEANHRTPVDLVMSFCLSYGELSSTVGLMYDLFRKDITTAEKQVFLAMLDKFLMRAALNCLAQPPWWANKIWSNWNGVCAGGMGVMALAFYDDVPRARELIPFVEASLGEYFKSYVQNGGGCAEGTGYWNYGMTYAMRYLLSWENATGMEHPAFGISELGSSLSFPLDFNGVSFGDNDGWGPMGFFFMLARRLKQKDAALRAAVYLLDPARCKRKPDAKRNPLQAETGDLLYASDCIPTLAEMEKLKAARAKKKLPVASIYKGMDWAALADDGAFPALRMAVRGGSSVITGHGMIDLLSIRCRVHGELMITDQQDGGYMQTTFSQRGHELYGRSAASKSTLFVDGLGCRTDAMCDKTEGVKGRGLLGIRIDATHVYLARWKDLFIGRLVLMVDASYWLVIDHVMGANDVDCHWAESRFHTLALCKFSEDGALLTSGKQQMQMTFASLGQPGVLKTSSGMPSQPTLPATTILRWMGGAATHDNLLVTALHPGKQKLGLRVEKNNVYRYVIEVSRPDEALRRILLNPDLTLV
ncbi:MAG TPA: hypothetical protein DCS43_13980, partial [Verrucomicrobia bacterium]|nr:hypothetical protein [Verrucomicrobiota bacterium]